ncbi:GNAT family N-acetyltransferase [Deinococcus sp.]|uniref:GNAT family N-acetyltransferase n=1 Tax=Deinococcus sp. TaxID=47478 RepID=UPI0025C06869|nr:GNAT family N-acetyltransferase [Deinococcus sp.]
MTVMSLQYQNHLGGIQPTQLEGFFVNWPDPPSAATLRRILENSYAYVLAVAPGGQVVGFVNAISDGVLSAYIPLLEVRPEWQSQGIGSALVQHLLAGLSGLYMIDTSCDDDLVAFYQRFGMSRGNALFLRNYAAQSGRCETI